MSLTGSRSTSSRRHIGGGLVEIEATPRKDPAEAVLADPQVPERHRFCGRCGAEVGRGDPAGGRPGRAEGFCSQCGTRFSFLPGLSPGDLVAGQYEVLGAIAHGGLGWIHLALDKAVDDRWVVLKGLIDTGDEAAMAAAVAERGFLARIVHPRIVTIHNVVADTRGPDAGAYIVMEYVDGRSLRQMRDPRAPMDPAVALAYVLEVLPALAHMHDMGLLYCDFKPDNAVQTGTEMRLIDLGAVRRMDDAGGDVWGTVGYQAPEIRPGGPGPSVASDVYTVGRSLAVLTVTFDFARTMTDRLPAAIDAPALAEHDGFRRLLARATDRDPARRFPTIPALAEQATGVLRQIVAGRSTTPPPPRLSAVFSPPRRAVGIGVDAPPAPAAVPTSLPVPLADADDPAAPALSSPDPRETLASLAALAESEQPADTVVARQRAVLAHAELGDLSTANARLAEQRSADPGWAWVEAVVAAAAGDIARWCAGTEAVLDTLPGELAGWFLAAVAREHAGDLAGAVRAHELVWRTDRAWISAAFGLARARLALGERDVAVAVLDEVPATSVHHVDAQVAAVRLKVAAGTGRVPTRNELLDAADRAGAVDLDVLRRAELECEILEAAARYLDGTPSFQRPESGNLMDTTLDAEGIGAALEARLRTRARFATSLEARIALVDRANDARPWSRV